MVSRQRGVTLMGFLMVLVVLSIFAFIGMRLFPVFSEFYSVKSDLDAVANDPANRGKSLLQLQQVLEKRFYISYVESVDPKKHVQLVRVNPRDPAQLTVKYEVRRPMAYNVDFVAMFEHSATLKE